MKFVQSDFVNHNNENDQNTKKKYPPIIPSRDSEDYSEMEVPVHLVGVKYEPAKNDHTDPKFVFSLLVKQKGHFANEETYNVTQFVKPDMVFENGHPVLDSKTGEQLLYDDGHGNPRYSIFAKKMRILQEVLGVQDFAKSFEDTNELLARLKGSIVIKKNDKSGTGQSCLFVATIKAWWAPSKVQDRKPFQVYQLGYVKLYDPAGWGKGRDSESSKKH